MQDNQKGKYNFLITMWSLLFIPSAESKSQDIVKKLALSYTNKDFFGLTQDTGLARRTVWPITELW